MAIIWIFTGLIGFVPWQAIEANSISQILDLIQNEEIIAPLAASDITLAAPPLSPLDASFFAKLFATILTLHEDARLSNALWLAITLTSIGLTTR